MRMFHKSLTPFLCDKHLLGAHGEVHKHRHNFTKGHSITGRIAPVVQIEPWRMGQYHEELAAEMLARGFKHASPYEMPDLSYLSEEERMACVSLQENIQTLTARCPKCKERIPFAKSEGIS